MKHLPEIRVEYARLGIMARRVVWVHEGQEIDLTPLSVSRVERDADFNHTPLVRLSVMARLVEVEVEPAEES